MKKFDNNEEQEFYLEQLMDNYKNPKNVGKLKDYTFFKHQKNKSCGDSFDLFVKIDEKNNKIIDVKFLGEGCAISTASFSLFSQKLINMDYDEAKLLTDKDVYKLFGIKISPGRINCAMLSINTFQNGIKEYLSKK